MSANGPLEDRDVAKLAPLFAIAVERAVADCHQAGLDAIVWEAYRSNELQLLYYLRGRPPTVEYPAPVTYARSNRYSWHGYYLAVDVISRKERWFNPDPLVLRSLPNTEAREFYITQRREQRQRWFREVADIFKTHGCNWGGDWRPRVDQPHFQWGRLKPSPSDQARVLLAGGGLEAVWRAVGAV